jgi:hypothetical protein
MDVARHAQDAYPSRVDYVNGEVRDKYVNGVWQNPYEQFKVMAMSPSGHTIKGRTFKILLTAGNFYSNVGSIANIEFDQYSNGGYQPIVLDTPIAVHYENYGLKEWRFRITLTTGEQYESSTKVILESGEIPELGVDIYEDNITTLAVNNWACDGSILYNIRAEADIAHEQQFARGTIQFVDRGQDCQITNPLIVAEGYDLTSVIFPNQLLGESSIQTFLGSINQSGSTDLRNELDINNYDIIYLNWDRGADFIQRNAFLLEEVIEWVNANKAPNAAPTVLLGQSMGGVVGRYALSHMENRGVAHDVELFISQDSPQQGANVPLGSQMMYRHLTNQYI